MTIDEARAHIGDAYDAILREIPPAGSTTSWSAGRDHRLRVAADGMRMVLAALLDVTGRDPVDLVREACTLLAGFGAGTVESTEEDHDRGRQ
jgi:hypothetical protein